LQAGADPNFNTPLVKAYESLGENSLQAIENVIRKGADPNAQDMYKQAILLTCTDVEKLKLLVAYGADINIKSTYWTSKGYTPVMSLMDKDAWESILFLLEKGADIDHQAEDGSTLKRNDEKETLYL
jgi:ankyrin repeat protein